MPAQAAAAACTLARIAEWTAKGESDHFIIDGTINGRKVGILLDTGARTTLIHRAAAVKLGLQRRSEPGLRAFGIGGETTVESVDIDEFRIGGAARRNFRMLVAGERDLGERFSVVLGDDFLQHVDIEFDLPNKVVRLFSARDCEGAWLAYWAKAGAGVVALESGQGIRFQVRVNDHPLAAMLDSGASTSVLSWPAAMRAGVQPDDPKIVPAGCAVGFGRRVAEVSVAPFESFAIGDELVRHPRLRVAAVWKDVAFAETGSRVPRVPDNLPEMLLGADFLRSHRVFVARSQAKLYFTHAGGLVFPAVPSVACGVGQQAKGPDPSLAGLDAAVARDPGDARARVARAEALLRKKEFDRALADLDAAIGIDPRNAAALMRRASIHAEKRDFDRAIADLDEAIARGARTALVHLDRGRAWREKGDTARALADFERAIELDPRGYRGHAERAAIRLAQGQLDLAIADYDAAVARGANGSWVYTNRGGAWQRRGDAGKALADYGRAIALDSRDVFAYLSRASLWLDRQEFDKAVADCDAALAIEPAMKDALEMRAMTLFYQGRFGAAQDAFDQLMRVAPAASTAIWRFVAGARGGNDALAQLRAFAEGGTGAWPAPIVAFHLGRLDRDGLLAAARHAEVSVARERACEANFHVAQRLLIAGDPAAAVPYLKLAAGACPTDLVELRGAAADLRRIP
ncbi:MAG: aspartyl protease family protein [Burkholderiales bacterium]